MEAIANRDNRRLAELLAARPDLVNQTGPHPRWGGRPQPLHVAIESGNAGAFDLLLKCGADVNGDNRQYDGWSPLMLAIHWKRPAMRAKLIRRGAAIDLVAALLLGDDRRAAALLADSAGLPDVIPNNGTLLHFARTVKSARWLLVCGIDIAAKDKYGKTAPERWAQIRPRAAGLLRLADSLGVPARRDIYQAVECGEVAQVRKFLAAGADVNGRFPDGSQHTLLHAAAWNGDLAMARLLISKGADPRAIDREHGNSPAGWARFALSAFRRESCKAVAEYLERLTTDEARDFGPLFAKLKLRFERRRRASDGLVCKQGSYSGCLVLKLQKASWTNDPMDRTENRTGIFFSLWIDEAAASRNRVNYNIHALQLRQLRGYSLRSRDFAAAFRSRFEPVRDTWPNVDTGYGPQTLMQGWIELRADGAEEELFALMEGFERLSPEIDSLLESRRKL